MKNNQLMNNYSNPSNRVKILKYSSERKKQDWRESLIHLSQHISLITVLVIGIGYINLHSYFIEFGISIYHHVDVSEILLSFLPLPIATLYIAGLIVLLSFTPELIFSHDPAYKWIHRLITLFLGILLIIFSAYLYFSNVDHENHFFISVSDFQTPLVICITIIILFVRSALDWVGHSINREKKEVIYFVLAIIATLAIVIIPNKLRASNIRNCYAPTEVILTFNNNIERPTKSDETSIYLGMTNNYYFFWESITNKKGGIMDKITIVKKSDVYKAEFINNKY